VKSPIAPPEVWECLYCLSAECHHKTIPIPLPFATPPPTEQNLGWWPNRVDWLYVACPECRQISAYVTSSPVVFQDSKKRPHANKFWFCISFRCAVEGCNTPIQFHVLEEPTITQTTESEWRERLASGYWKGASPCGHPISITSGQKVSFHADQGRLWGYDPNDPAWAYL
jgi:hypothetical protein